MSKVRLAGLEVHAQTIAGAARSGPAIPNQVAGLAWEKSDEENVFIGGRWM
jgi:hypothetical protein